MMHNLFDIVNVAQLEVLGFKQEYRYIVFFVVSFVIVSMVLKPFITIISNLNYIYVLTYVISSLLLIVITSMIAYVDNNLVLLKTVFDSLVIFGILFVLYIVSKLFKKQRKSV